MTRVPFFTGEASRTYAITGTCRTESTLGDAARRDLDMEPSSTYGIATSVFRALPSAPRVVLTYASRLDTRTEKSSRVLTVLAYTRLGGALLSPG